MKAENALSVLPPTLVLGLLTLLGLRNYLLFHSLLELFSIVISAAAFLMIWNVRKRVESGFLPFIGIAYAGVSILDLIHMLSYRGMGVFQGLTANEPSQLWIAARLLQAVSLLVAPFFAVRPIRARFFLAFFGIVDALILLTIFRPWPFLPAFPDCYVEGADPSLTPFKVGAEYLVVALLLAAMGHLALMRRWIDRLVFGYMVTAIGLTAVSELFFTGYVFVYGGLNMTGHLLKAAAFFLTYKALVESGLIRPFDVLFRNASQSRQQLLESEERLRTLSAATFEGIAITENGRIVDANEQLLDLLGRRREELIGEPISAFLVPEDRERVLQGIREGLETLVDHRMVRKDGSFFHVETHGKMVHFKNRTVRVTAIRDVTERKRIEESLLEARNAALRAARELARSNRDLEQFAHVTSHDLKEPLRMVTGFLSLLREQYAGRLDGRATSYVDSAVEAGQRMQRLVDDLLDYSRIGRDRSVDLVPLDEALDAALENLKSAVLEADARLTRDPLPTIRANRVEMIRLFQNLLSNALKFRGASPPVIHVGARPAGGMWELSVRDNGIGIDPAYTGRLFQIFQRLHPPGDFPGSGVGLAICKKIVEEYGGDIRVESVPGQGTTFLFTMPVEREGT